MPLYSKYLTKAYIKVFLLCTFGFISVLLITKLKDIAKFATLTPNFFKVILFTLYQIPSVLPLAISISCLISAFLLFQKFSKNSELTAFRASGISIKRIIFPIVMTSLFISFLNFIISSEITPYCKIHSKKIAHIEISENPIVLLDRHQILNIKNAYIDLKASSDMQSAKDIILIVPNKGNNKLNFVAAKKLSLENSGLIGKDISIISYFSKDTESNQNKGFSTLILENQKKMVTEASNISKYMKSNSFSFRPIHLPTKMLLIRNQSLPTDKAKNDISPILEIIKRAAISLSAFSFTFIGIGFGIEITRKKSKKKIFFVTICALIILLSFTIAKGLRYNFLLASLFYILPQPIMIVLSILSLRKISRGLG